MSAAELDVDIPGLKIEGKVEFNWASLGALFAEQNDTDQIAFLNEALAGFDAMGSFNKGMQIQHIGDRGRLQAPVDEVRLALFLARIAKALDPEVEW